MGRLERWRKAAASTTPMAEVIADGVGVVSSGCESAIVDRDFLDCEFLVLVGAAHPTSRREGDSVQRARR
jgi:hypothetical protein